MTSPQGTHLQVSQAPGQTVAPGQQIAVRSVAPVRLATGIKPVVTATDRPMQGVLLKMNNSTCSTFKWHTIEYLTSYLKIQ